MEEKICSSVQSLLNQSHNVAPKEHHNTCCKLSCLSPKPYSLVYKTLLSLELIARTVNLLLHKPQTRRLSILVQVHFYTTHNTIAIATEKAIYSLYNTYTLTLINIKLRLRFTVWVTI